MAAAHYAALRIVRDEGGSVCSMFFKAFRINFFQALPLGVISLLAGAVIGTDLYLLSGPVQPKGAAGLFYAGSYRVSFHSLRDSYAVAVAGTCNL